MDSNPTEIYIHFDIEEHFIPVNDFSTSSNSIVTIADVLNKRILNGELKYQLVVIPPRNGTFLKITGIKPGTAGAFTKQAIIAGLIASASIGAFKGITGHTPEYYVENSSEALRDLVVGFLETPVIKLEKCVPKEMNLDKAFKAKSEFFEMCIKNKDIGAIGFDITKKFPIPRPAFYDHLSKDRVREIESEFATYDAIIISPVDVDRDTKWTFEEKRTGTKISAYMRDSLFKGGFLSGNYPLKQTVNDDIVRIRIEYKRQEKNGEIETKEICVETVYLFNEIEVTPIPDKTTNNRITNLSNEMPFEKLWEI